MNQKPISYFIDHRYIKSSRLRRLLLTHLSQRRHPSENRLKIACRSNFFKAETTDFHLSRQTINQGKYVLSNIDKGQSIAFQLISSSFVSNPAELSNIGPIAISNLELRFSLVSTDYRSDPLFIRLDGHDVIRHKEIDLYFQIIFSDDGKTIFLLRSSERSIDRRGD